MIENSNNRFPLVIELSLVAEVNERQRLFDLLSSDERSRAERFAANSIRDRFVVARGRLRLVLGYFLGIAPQLVEFEYGEFGKPFPAAKHDSKLAFNLSHSRDKALIAVTDEGHVGIDIEVVDTDLHVEPLALQLFGENELQCWRQLPVDVSKRVLLQAWVCKEAVVKAMGIGWSQGLLSIALPKDFFIHEENRRKVFEIDVASNLSPASESCEAKNNSLRKLFLRILEDYPGYCAALCCISPPSCFACASWDEFLEILPQD